MPDLQLETSLCTWSGVISSRRVMDTHWSQTWIWRHPRYCRMTLWRHSNCWMKTTQISFSLQPPTTAASLGQWGPDLALVHFSHLHRSCSWEISVFRSFFSSSGVSRLLQMSKHCWTTIGRIHHSSMAQKLRGIDDGCLKKVMILEQIEKNPSEYCTRSQLWQNMTKDIERPRKTFRFHENGVQES